MARAILLLNFSAVEAILAKYMTDLRDYPREDAGWVLAPTTLTMMLSTFLTTYFHRRPLRTLWLFTAAVGGGGCVWWLASIHSFTPREQTLRMHTRWGLLLALVHAVCS